MIKEVREYYGLSQDTLAGLLGISRSHLSMAESGFREIFGEAGLRLVELYRPILEREMAPKKKLKKAHPELSENLAKCDEWAAKEILDIEHEMYSLKKDLETATARYQKAVTNLESLEILKVSKADHKWISGIHVASIRAAEILNKTGEKEVLQLKLRMVGLEAQLDYLKKRG